MKQFLVTVIGIGKRKDSHPLQLQGLHEGLGVATIALGDGYDFIQVQSQSHRVNSLYPTTNIAGESLEFCFLHQGLLLGMGDKDVVEVYGRLSGSEEDFDGDGRCKSDSAHLGADHPIETIDLLNNPTIHQSVGYDNPHHQGLRKHHCSFASVLVM